MDQNKLNNENNEKVQSPSLPVEETQSITHHRIKLHNQEMAYTVTTGTIILKEEDFDTGEKQKASVFYIAYTKDGEDRNRPVTFSFNGGP